MLQLLIAWAWLQRVQRAAFATASEASGIDYPFCSTSVTRPVNIITNITKFNIILIFVRVTDNHAETL